MLYHKHLILNASDLRQPLRTAASVEVWLRRLVELVEMKRLIGPHAVRCDVAGNEGVTGIVGIETSHASLHIWDTVAVPFLRFDLYSCTDFPIAPVLDHVQVLAPARYAFVVLDRNPDAAIPVLETGTWEAS